MSIHLFIAKPNNYYPLIFQKKKKQLKIYQLHLHHFFLNKTEFLFAYYTIA